jgi:hypothetical protein
MTHGQKTIKLCVSEYQVLHDHNSGQALGLQICSVAHNIFVVSRDSPDFLIFHGYLRERPL